MKIQATHSFTACALPVSNSSWKFCAMRMKLNGGPFPSFEKNFGPYFLNRTFLFVWTSYILKLMDLMFSLNDYEEYSLLGSKTMYSGGKQTSSKNISPPSSRMKSKPSMRQAEVQSKLSILLVEDPVWHMLIQAWKELWACWSLLEYSWPDEGRYENLHSEFTTFLNEKLCIQWISYLSILTIMFT